MLRKTSKRARRSQVIQRDILSFLSKQAPHAVERHAIAQTVKWGNGETRRELKVLVKEDRVRMRMVPSVFNHPQKRRHFYPVYQYKS